MTLPMIHDKTITLLTPNILAILSAMSKMMIGNVNTSLALVSHSRVQAKNQYSYFKERVWLFYSDINKNDGGHSYASSDSE